MTIRALAIAIATATAFVGIGALAAPRSGEIQVAHEGHAHNTGTGTVNAVDLEGRKLNISHKAIPALGWPAMKMDFPVAGSVDLKALKPGAQIEFKLEKSKDGGYEIEAVKPIAGK